MSTAVLSRTAGDTVPPPDPTGPDDQPIVVPGTSSDAGTGPVVVAVDDDGNAGAVLRYAAAVAAGLGVALRAAYVWSDCRPPDCPHHQRCHRDLGEASELLDGLLAEQLPFDEPLDIEREVVHEADPADALVALSGAASLLVVGWSSHRPESGGEPGDTTRALLGRTRCPVLVVPFHQRSATRGAP